MNRPTFEMTPERRAEIVRLREYLEGLKDGARVTWLEIEQATGIVMKRGSPGRSLVRIVLRKMSRCYLPIRGAGLELSSAANMGEIVMAGAVGLQRRIRREASKPGLLLERHEKDATVDQKKFMNEHQAKLATLALTVQVTRALTIRKTKDS